MDECWVVNSSDERGFWAQKWTGPCYYKNYNNYWHAYAVARKLDEKYWKLLPRYQSKGLKGLAYKMWKKASPLVAGYDLTSSSKHYNMP